MTNRTPKIKMGAGIAADPRSPDFDPLGCAFALPAPSGFGGMLSRCRGGHLALRFGRSLPVWSGILRSRAPSAACILPHSPLSGASEHLAIGPAFGALPACARSPPLPIDIPLGIPTVSLRHQQVIQA